MIYYVQKVCCISRFNCFYFCFYFVLVSIIMYFYVLLILKCSHDKFVLESTWLHLYALQDQLGKVAKCWFNFKCHQSKMILSYWVLWANFGQYLMNPWVKVTNCWVFSHQWMWNLTNFTQFLVTLCPQIVSLDCWYLNLRNKHYSINLQCHVYLIVDWRTYRLPFGLT